MKKYFLIIAGLLLLMPLTSNAFSGQGGCGGNCIDCHKLEKKDAEAVVKKLKDLAEKRDCKYEIAATAPKPAPMAPKSYKFPR